MSFKVCIKPYSKDPGLLADNLIFAKAGQLRTQAIPQDMTA